ncbi:MULTISPECIES: SulP family inorganic anion transporter [Tenebrionibacter/Tenebrionicola group]|jgi:MFS superfamily sulfate permease-like transporter|uniref:SulP family inorganic anion transporter n=2 Tax=Tenebrionibacter/Tenebrionicola group TaxID=2969848 RepID=A0A8K0XZ64_9ENTR|nr:MULTISPECIES: SulP family inorganic anion transporter [Tenebrionibacter/Tenebrionicola group]MBK4715264.1 SulP family inorganic anion transporter [Tenebrionibacter intestinalis]MBV5096010.1 SulP family inorganic anion transporter [Tenebrionicola larvae]
MSLAGVRSDVLAGIIVFLVALPMNLGIAQACGLPPVLGVVTGVTGGLMVAVLSPSRFAVSGPAAGLVTIILASAAQLGSYPQLLTAIVLAGGIQLLMGWLKAGRWIALVPGSVIAGMLAAIGIMLIVQQLPVALAFDKTHGQFSFLSLALTIVSLTILFGWDMSVVKRRRMLSMIPGPLLAVVCATAVLWLAADARSTVKTVMLPELASVTAWQAVMNHPDWQSALMNPRVWTVALTIALVASLETLLSLEALKKLKDQRPEPCANRELYAQGAGNILSGLCGGLPVTSVIVRSSVNVNAGARTRLSVLIHCLLLLAAVVWFSGIISLIPMPVLAAILIATGYKLAAPKVFLQQWRQGLFRFVPFLITLFGIIVVDMLSGIALGFVTQLLCNMLARSASSSPLRRKKAS